MNNRVFKCYTFGHVRAYLKRPHIDPWLANYVVSGITHTVNENLPLKELSERYELFVSKYHKKPRYKWPLYLPK